MNTKRRTGEGDVAFFCRNVGMGVAAGTMTETLTIPIDTAKVRM
mgnify:CR=1 FL=1